MKVQAVQALRGKLSVDQPVHGIWVTLESASVTEMAVALGLDYVVIDAEHGHLGWQDIVQHVRATVRSNTVALVRISELNCALIKRVLDIGADGIIIPWMETAEQVEEAVAFARYPTRGKRGVGGERATGWGTCFAEHVAQADEHVLVVPLIESVRGGKNIEQICQVEGVEMFYQGPADFSASAGHAGQWEGPGVAEQILAVNDAIRAAGKHCGIMVRNPEDLALRLEQGFRLMGLGMDGSLLVRGIQNMLAAAGEERKINSSLEFKGN